MEHQKLRENLDALYEITQELKTRQLEMQPLSKTIKELKVEKEKYKNAIREELKLSNQEGVEYKNLKIEIKQKALKTRCRKKEDREEALSKALRDLGISDTSQKAKHILKTMDTVNTEQKDFLRVQIKKK